MPTTRYARPQVARYVILVPPSTRAATAQRPGAAWHKLTTDVNGYRISSNARYEMARCDMLDWSRVWGRGFVERVRIFMLYNTTAGLAGKQYRHRYFWWQGKQ